MPQLSRRIRQAMSRFAAATALLFIAAFVGALMYSEDSVLRAQLEQELARARGELARTGRVTARPPFGLRIGPKGPGPKTGDLAPGHHEIDEPERDLMVLVDAEGPLVVWLDTSHLEFSNQPLGRGFILIAIAGALLIWLVGRLSGRALAAHVTAPITALAERVRTGSAEEAEDALGDAELDEELAFFVRELRAKLIETRAYGDREAQFTRYASHELRTPVAVIKGAQTILARAALPEAAAGPLARIGRATRDLEQLIGALLWLARAPDASGDESAVDARALIETTMDRHQLTARDKGIEISLRGETTTTAPPGVLEMVIDNLLSNAIRNMQRGHIDIELLESEIRLADDGPGLDMDAEDAVQPFVRGARSPGQGLGLALVHSVSERMGWTFSLEGRPEGGTLARLRF